MFDVQALLKDLDAESAAPRGDETTKTAAAAAAPTTTTAVETDDGAESLDKLATDLESAGVLMADAFVDRAIEKLAAAKALSSHAAGTGVKQPSQWSAAAERLQKMHSKGKGNPDEGHTRAEQAYKRLANKAPMGGKGRESY